jgi:predicted methyltransferase
MKAISLLISALLCGNLWAANGPPLSQQEINAILNAPDRPAQDKSRDNDRKPDKVLAFSQISKGDHILDLLAGGGWYTELFSHAVGESGKVYGLNDEVIWRFAEKGMSERTKDMRLGNVIRLDKMAIVDMQIPDKSLDMVFTALNYHDLFFTYSLKEGKKLPLRKEIVDYKAALATIKKAMKDDGVFIIIDHAAKAGSGYEVANTLHRIDPNIIKYQLDEAGFVLAEEANYLRHPEDDLTKFVFDDTVRGKTDRVIYKFVKK